MTRPVRIASGAFALLALAACGDNAAPHSGAVLTPRFVSDELQGCIFASPIAGKHAGADVVVVASAAGEIEALDPDDGRRIFSLAVPAPAGQTANVTATPGLAGNELVVAWQDALPDHGVRQSHHVGVVDLDAGAFDPRFADTTLSASQQGVEFLASNEFSRAAIPIAHPADRQLGLAYVAFGNIQDLQPWHGWVFELDLDAWAAGRAPVTGTLLTTATNDCGTPGTSGSSDMRCGGGVWSPAGPKIYPTATGYEVYVPTGNGKLDPTNGAYANTILRTGRGLAFDPACDPTACAGWDESDASLACEQSCANLFVPRLRPGDPVPHPPGGLCDGKSFFECYAVLDWDLGASSPARVSIPGGPDVLVVPAKDGGLYLADATHLGTLYDRRQLAAVCGSDGSTCAHNWAGMMVTEPAVTELDGMPVVLVPTFEYDPIHPAGLVALAIVMDGGAPAFRPLWQAPDAGSDEAVRAFREHEGRVAIATVGGEPTAFLVDVHGGGNGVLYAIRVRDGAIVQRQTLAGPGQRYVEPLVLGDRLYLSSCEGDGGPGHVEAFTLASGPP